MGTAMETEAGMRNAAQWCSVLIWREHLMIYSIALG
jgi:hypothetical protein